MKVDDNKISKHYSNAIKGRATTLVSATGQAKFADYSGADLQVLSDDVTEHSFGCGDPVAFSSIEPGQTVLDLGCGAGLDLLLAAQKVGDNGRVIGIDFNDDMLALAKKRTGEYQNIELKKGKIEALPIPANSVDWVISNCVINLSNDKQNAFAEIARVLKPDGRMIVSDIVAEKLPWWLKYSGVLRAACVGGVISEQQYLAGLATAGLKQGEVVAHQYYEASQLASIVSDAAPQWLGKLRCCGYQVLQRVATVLAKPVANRIWSAKIAATAQQG